MRRQITTLAIAAAASLFSVGVSAQELKINVSDATYTKPLIERLIAEYQKQVPGFLATVVTDGTADGSVSLNASDDAHSIGRVAVLPIANAQSAILENKKVRKGLDTKVAHKLFVKKSIDEQIDEAQEAELPGTVYSLTGAHAVTTDLVAKALNVKASDIKGKKVLGKDENVLTVVVRRPDAVSFNVATLVYDLKTRKPVNGISVLNVDLDGNGRITDEERQAVTDLDSLIAYLGKANRVDVPTGNITFTTSNSQLQNFAAWIETSGQDILPDYGYLKANRSLTAQK